MKKWRVKLKQISGNFRDECFTLFWALRDRRINIAVKIVIFLFLCYLVSPIDIIPDYIPVLGLVDDFLIIFLGFMLINLLIPAPVLADIRVRAKASGAKLPRKLLWIGIGLIIALWAAFALLIVQIYWLLKK